MLAKLRRVFYDCSENQIFLGTYKNDVLQDPAFSMPLDIFTIYGHKALKSYFETSPASRKKGNLMFSVYLYDSELEQFHYTLTVSLASLINGEAVLDYQLIPSTSTVRDASKFRQNIY